MTIVHHDQHTTTIVDLPTRDETLDPTGREAVPPTWLIRLTGTPEQRATAVRTPRPVAPEITHKVKPLRWHGYTVWEWHLNDPTMSTCRRVMGVQPTEARATQRAAEAARIHEQLHAITRLSSRRWTYEIDGVEMTYKHAIRALTSKGVPEIHAHDWLSGISYKAEEEGWW